MTSGMNTLPLERRAAHAMHKGMMAARRCRLYRETCPFRNKSEHNPADMPERIYLDHAATTQMLPEARHAWMEASMRWANPSSPHAEGRAAKAALEDARVRIAAALGWTGSVIFTSGASEAIAIALTRTNVGRVVASAVEHDSVLRLAGEGERLPVDISGVTSFHHHSRESGNPTSDLSTKRHGPELGPCFRGDDEKGGRGDDVLFAIQHANSETGVLQPLDQLIPQIRAANGILFADCAQTAGKLPLPDADLIAIGAHKFGGPPGIGALLVRDLALLEPSGGQERGYRGGTEDLPAILAMAAALDAGREWMTEAADLRAFLDMGVVQAGGVVIAADAPRIPTIASYAMPGVPARAQLIRFDLGGIAVSAGSACSSGTLKPSHVLEAMRIDPTLADSAVRVSFGRTTTRDDIDRFLDVWRAIAGDAKSRAA